MGISHARYHLARLSGACARHSPGDGASLLAGAQWPPFMRGAVQPSDACPAVADLSEAAGILVVSPALSNVIFCTGTRAAFYSHAEVRRPGQESISLTPNLWWRGAFARSNVLIETTMGVARPV